MAVTEASGRRQGAAEQHVDTAAQLRELAEAVLGLQPPDGGRAQSLAQRLKELAACGLDVLDLLERERRARTEAEERARLQGLLADAGTIFAGSLDLGEVLSAVTSITVPEFADWCGVTLLTPDGELQIAAESASDDNLLSAIHALRQQMRPSLDAPHGVGAVIRTGESEFFPTVPDEVLREIAAAAGVPHEALLSLHIESGLVVPLTLRGRPLGALSMVRSRPVAYIEDELHFAEDLAARAALAMDNATKFTLERQAADMLQRSLLPQELPQMDSAVVATRYLPGGSGLRIGGDWYDIIDLGPGHYGIVVGDVMGRGVPAASVMGQVRAAVRAYAVEGHGPAALLTLVDALVQRTDELHFTTCLYGVYDQAAGTFTVAAAGHPPPLLMLEQGTTQFLDLPADLPLGVGVLAPGQRTDTKVALPPGSTLVLYTDGLVEGHDRSIEDGMRRLRHAVTGWRSGPEELCEHVLSKLERNGHHSDDTALVVLAVRGDGTPEWSPGASAAPDAGHPVWKPFVDPRIGPGLVAPTRIDVSDPRQVRHMVREQLTAWRVADPDSAVYVVHELVANALLHAKEPITVRLLPLSSGVRIEVADGSRTPPMLRSYTEDAFTGRGLSLVDKLSERWGWQHSDHGKVVWCEVNW